MRDGFDYSKTGSKQRRNRVPAHISKHQPYDILDRFVGKDKQNSPPKKPSLLWGSPVSRLQSAVEAHSNDHH